MKVFLLGQFSFVLVLGMFESRVGLDCPYHTRDWGPRNAFILCSTSNGTGTGCGGLQGLLAKVKAIRHVVGGIVASV